MATATDMQAELVEFIDFLNKAFERGDVRLTVESSVTEFRAWQGERDRLREELRPAIESSLRGEGRPWNNEEFLNEVHRRLADREASNAPSHR